MGVINREHDKGVVAIHKKTHKLFGGKAAGTHIGYSKRGHLKQAIINANKDPEDYTYQEFYVDDNGALAVSSKEVN